MPTLSQRYKRPPPRHTPSKPAVPPARRLLQSMVVIVLLTGVKVLWFEKTVVGEQFELAAINLMQNSLVDLKAEPNVVVVDITSLQMETNGQPGGPITPRVGLKQVLQQVAKADPAAIGVDILFEPDEAGHLSEQDEHFLKECLATKNSEGRRIPTFVGVYNPAIGQQAWKGGNDCKVNPNYGCLDKAVLIPRDEKPSMPIAELFKTLTMTVDGKPIEAQSMSDALVPANAGEEQSSSVPALYETVRTTTDKGITLTRYRLNYGLLNRLIKDKVPRDEVQNQLAHLHKKIVLIGCATAGNTDDMFSVPGHGDPVPGVFLHAVGVETLLHKPLSTLTDLGRVLMDVAVAAVVAVLLYSLDLLYWRKFEPEREEHTYEIWAKRCEIGVGLLVLASGFVVTATRLFWTDYLMVALALFLHGTFEKFFKWTYRSAA